jgi:hypothetical protein
VESAVDVLGALLDLVVSVVEDILCVVEQFLSGKLRVLDVPVGLWQLLENLSFSDHQGRSQWDEWYHARETHDV